MSTNRDEMMRILEEKYPKMWTKESEDFRNGTNNAIWTGEGSYDNEGNNLFDYNAGFWDRKEQFYILGVRKELRSLMEEHGWYPEWHDGGTVFFYQS